MVQEAEAPAQMPGDTGSTIAVNSPRTTFKVIVKELDGLSNKVSPLYHIGLCC